MPILNFFSCAWKCHINLLYVVGVSYLPVRKVILHIKLDKYTSSQLYFTVLMGQLQLSRLTGAKPCTRARAMVQHILVTAQKRARPEASAHASSQCMAQCFLSEPPKIPRVHCIVVVVIWILIIWSFVPYLICFYWALWLLNKHLKINLFDWNWFEIGFYYVVISWLSSDWT